MSEFKQGLILGGAPNAGGKGMGLILKPSAHIKDIKPLSLFKQGEAMPVPDHLDAKSQLLSSTDQGNSSECVAYAIAGLIAFFNWKYLGQSVHIDPHPIYVQAKKIDGIPGDGTTLAAAFQAVQDLGILPKVAQGKIREISNAWEMKRALHVFDVALTAWDITDNWMKADAEGWIPDGGTKIGGHATLSCGFSTPEPRPYYEFQGSWGAQGWFGFNKISPAAFEDQFQYALVCQWPDGVENVG